MEQELNDPITDRFLAFVNLMGLKNKDLQAVTNLSDSYFSHIRKKRRRLTHEVTVKLLESYPILSKDWLLHGEGSMLVQVDSNVHSVESFDLTLLITELSQIEGTLDLLRKSVARIRNQITIKLKE